MKDMNLNVKHIMNAGGAGWPTAEELIAVLHHMPPKAKPKLQLHDSQREGSSWSLTAEWDEATQQAWKPSPTLNYPPGVRARPGKM